MPSSLSKEFDLKLAKEAGFALNRWPENEEEAKRAEEFLANELANLSLVEHEKILFDIYGIMAQEKEDPEMIDSKLNELQSELDRIESKEDYDQALQMNPAYVESRDFRLLFLRHEQFDAKSAAIMMVAHFVEKRTLFGSGEVLARDIVQADLGINEMSILRSGYLQMLPVRDASGRLIEFMTRRPADLVLEDEDDLCECRAVWYETMALLRDGESYSRGAVCLMMDYDFRMSNVNAFAAYSRMESSLPLTSVGSHYCYSDPDLTPLVHGVHIMMPEHCRCRFRVHFGDRDQLDFKLQTYGIPTEALPYKRDGSISTEHHLTRLEMLRSQEERAATIVQTPPVPENHQIVEEEEQGVIYIPGRFDILFGKSLLAKEHTGTRRALYYVEKYFDDYERASGKAGKTYIVASIVSMIHESGGRFLKQNDDGSWSEAPDVDSKRKIAHWFRHSRSRKKGPLDSDSSEVPNLGETLDPDSSQGFPVSENDKTTTSTQVEGNAKRTVTLISPIAEIEQLEEEQAVHRYKKTVAASPSHHALTSW